MKMKIDQGLLSGVQYIPSPNFNTRPKNTEIDLLVIHNISLPPKEFGGSYIEDFFTNRLNIKSHPFFEELADMKVSAHCLIRREGKVIQFVPFSERAWHAGESSFLGRDNCNDYSIGIELEGADEIPYTEVQYETLAGLVCILLETYPKITFDRIVGHNVIAPTRKTDPGQSFNWLQLAKQILNKI